jgi:hypothetical protein
MPPAPPLAPVPDDEDELSLLPGFASVLLPQPMGDASSETKARPSAAIVAMGV